MTRALLIPANLDVLKEMVRFEMNAHGNACDLNHIDVSGITDFTMLFASSMFHALECGPGANLPGDV